MWQAGGGAFLGVYPVGDAIRPYKMKGEARLPLRVVPKSVDESNSSTQFGALLRPQTKKIKVHHDRKEAVSIKVRKRTETLPGGRFPMPDKKHARLALQMLDRAKDLSPEDKAKIKARAHSILGEADRSATGKLANGSHTTAAREHILAASIALNSGDKEEATRRITSARIHTSHSQHKTAPEAAKALMVADECLKSDKADAAATKLDEAYGSLQGEPNRLLQMKKQRESAVRSNGGKVIETLAFNPRFVEGTLDEKNRTVSVIIISEGMGNGRDKHYYTADALREAVATNVFNPCQAYADHPSKWDDQNRPERSIRDLVGYYFDAVMTEAMDLKTGKLVPAIGAKLKIAEGCDWALGLIKEAIDFAKKFPNEVFLGISINADGDIVPGNVDDIDVNKVLRITEAFSADMVTKPARGGRFLKLVESAAGAQRRIKVRRVA